MNKYNLTEYDDILSKKLYNVLRDEFPSLDLFKSNGDNIGNKNVRYRLNYTDDIIPHLSPLWVEFVESFNSESYKKTIEQMYGEYPKDIGMFWFKCMRGYDLKTHCDILPKISTQIFYFNDERDWKPEWGGNTVFYGQAESYPYPDPYEVDMMKTQSIIWKNMSKLRKENDEYIAENHIPHSVEKIKCPIGFHRNTFNISACRGKYDVTKKGKNVAYIDW